MSILVGALGLALVLIILWDGFETIILPRRVTRRFRFTRWYYRMSWRPWSAVARRMHAGRRRESFLSYYGPLSILFLLVLWAALLVVGFGMLHWGAGSELNNAGKSPGFGSDLYLSGTTFFTLGLGDVTARSVLGRVITVLEAATGFGFLAVVICYLPVLYQAFSRREVSISLLDARAGSPSSSAELLRRYGRQRAAELDVLLLEWEHWAAELLESHISYPVIGYFRSQHDNQSWVGALTTILDTCALVMTGSRGAVPWQAELTFAMARHAVVDLAQIYGTPPHNPDPDRLPASEFEKLRLALAEAGFSLDQGGEALSALAALRRVYEPYVNALSSHLLMRLPAWVPPARPVHNWETTAWEPFAPTDGECV